MTIETGIDLVPDQLALARAQMDAAQYGVVEGTLRRRIATLEATGRNPEELDAARALLAEALWRSAMSRDTQSRRRPTTLSPLRSSRPRISPTSPRWTPSGLTRTRVRSMTAGVSSGAS